MKNIKTLLMPFLALFLITTFSCKESSQKDESFVQIKNGSFYLNGKPYYYLGVNYWQGAYLAADIVKGDKQRLIEELDQMVKNGITNLRVMASSEASAFERGVSPAFHLKPRVYNEELLVGLDFLLSELAKRNMKAVLVLNNYWNWSGGMVAYLNWVDGRSIIDPEKSGNWDGFQAQSAEFYTNTTANEIYHDYIKMLVNRKNTVSGIIYKEDAAIMAWQLANEPRPAPDAVKNEKSRTAFINWISQSAEYIHSIDPNHLVSSGNEGQAGCRNNIGLFAEAHKSKFIDYQTFHIWPKNWGWHNAKQPETTYDSTVIKTLKYLDNHIQIAREQKKPIVLEEIGLERDSASISPNSSTNYRNRYLETIFAYMADGIKLNGPFTGFNFWAWGGKGKASSPDYVWKKGDSFLGDPPQEPQGLNSIFSSDAATLGLFKDYSDRLKK